MAVIVPENLAADIRIVTLRMICLAGPFFRGEHTSVKNDARKLRKLALIRLDGIEAHTEAFSTDPRCNSRAAGGGREERPPFRSKWSAGAGELVDFVAILSARRGE